MTEREYVIRLLARHACRRPQATLAELTAYLREEHGRSSHGGSGWLPHVPRDEHGYIPLDPATGRVAYPWLEPAHTYHFSCAPRGVYLGPNAHIRRDTPDITFAEIAAFARRGSTPQQMTLWSAG